jgi:amphi-Trp domain-containing protein
MTEIEWEQKLGREQAADLLRRVADGLAGGEQIELEQDGFELKVAVAEEVEVEIEVEFADGGTEVELELKWGVVGTEPDTEGAAAASGSSPGDGTDRKTTDDHGDASAGSAE